MGNARSADFYAVLNVSPDASAEEIRQAYRRALAQQTLKDDDRPEDVQALAEAYRVLGDPDQRAEYDRLRQAEISGGAESIMIRLGQALTNLRGQIDVSAPEAAVSAVIEKASDLLTKLQVTKVRVKHKDKPVLPDIPLIYGLLLEAGGLYTAGLLRVLVANLGVKTFMDIEIINEAEELVQRGDANYQAGEVEAAIRDYRQAIALDRTCGLAHFQLGVALRVRGDVSGAIEAFRKAVSIDPASELASKAKQQLDRLYLR